MAWVFSNCTDIMKSKVIGKTKKERNVEILSIYYIRKKSFYKKINIHTQYKRRSNMDRQLYLKEIDKVIENGKYKDTWDSLSQYRVPEWYRNAKFGIFIHWGVYSVPAFGGEWYPRNMYIQGSREFNHHIKTYGLHKEFGYKDFIPMFKAEKFNPAEWADLFEKVGAKYVVPVAEHHDGFQMYRSELSKYNS